MAIVIYCWCVANRRRYAEAVTRRAQPCTVFCCASVLPKVVCNARASKLQDDMGVMRCYSKFDSTCGTPLEPRKLLVPVRFELLQEVLLNICHWISKKSRFSRAYTWAQRLPRKWHCLSGPPRISGHAWFSNDWVRLPGGQQARNFVTTARTKLHMPIHSLEHQLSCF